MRGSPALLLFLAAAAILAPVGIASSPSLHVRPSRVHAGDRVRIFGSGGGCPAGEQLLLISRAFSHRHDFAGLPAVITRIRSDGRFDTRTTIPRRRRPRRYTITARCGGGNLGVEARLRVLPPR